MPTIRPLRALLFLSCIALAACSGGGSPSEPGPAPDTRARLARMLDSATAALSLDGASLLVVHADSVLFDGSRGDIGASTVIPIASASKWFSGAVILSLVDDGTLSLDATVGQYLPDAPPEKRGITLRQLFSHTSGLPAQARCLNEAGTTLDACAAEILALPLESAPGTRFAYGGASMQVAGRMAEVASGRTWAALFEERIAGPLGMESTRYPGSNPRIAGGVQSTRDDYARLLRMLLDEGTYDGRRVLSAAAVREMERDQTGGAALAYSPHPDGLHSYGIGMWRDLADAQGNAVQLSSQGAFGFSPWIDRERRLIGVFAVRDRLANVYELVEEIQAVARAGVDPVR